MIPALCPGEPSAALALWNKGFPSFYSRAGSFQSLGSLMAEMGFSFQRDLPRSFLFYL